jgi:hypothetical protein
MTVEQFNSIFDAVKNLVLTPASAAVWALGITAFALLVSARNRYGKE